MSNKIELEKIVDAGKSLKTIGYLLIVTIILQSLLILAAFNTRNYNNIKTFTFVCGALSLICVVIIMLQFISAGDSLIASSSDNLIKEDVLSHEEINLRNDNIKKHGGIVITSPDGLVLVVCPNDLGKMKWNQAALACANLTLNGFDNWRMPSKEELNLLYSNKNKIGGFSEDFYWSCSEGGDGYAWLYFFGIRNKMCYCSSKNGSHCVRPVYRLEI